MAKTSKTALNTKIATDLADNTTGDITAGDVRGVFTDVSDSTAHIDDSYRRRDWLATYGFRQLSARTLHTEGSVSLTSSHVREPVLAYDYLSEVAYCYVFRFDSTSTDRVFGLDLDIQNHQSFTGSKWVSYPSTGSHAYPIRVAAGESEARVIIWEPKQWTGQKSDGTRQYAAAVSRWNNTNVSFTNLTSQALSIDYISILHNSDIPLLNTTSLLLNSGDNDTTTVTFTTALDPAIHNVIEFELNPSGYSEALVYLDINRYGAVDPTALSFPSNHMKIVWRNDDDPPFISRMGEITGGGGWHREARIMPIYLAGGYHSMVGGLYIQWLINTGSTTSLHLQRCRARSNRM